MHPEAIQKGTDKLHAVLDGHDALGHTAYENQRFNGARGQNFSMKEFDLSGSTFIGAHFKDGDFTDATIQMGDFKLAVLSCKFIGANLNRTVFHRADLRGSNFVRANLDKANFSRANLEGVSLRGASLIDTSFKRANLKGARLNKTDLRGANFCGADLTDATLKDTDLTGAHYDEHTVWPKGFDTSAHTLVEPVRDFAGVDMQGADLAQANLIDAKLERANLTGANLTGANLKGANLAGANLSGANLHGADLRFAVLQGVNFRLADLSGANLGYANAADADFSEADLTGANMQCGGLETAILQLASVSSYTQWLPDFDHEKAILPRDERDDLRSQQAPEPMAPDNRPNTVPVPENLPNPRAIDWDQDHPLLRELPKGGLEQLWTDLVTALPVELTDLLLDEQFVGSLSLSEDALAIIDPTEQILDRIVWKEPFKVSLAAWPITPERLALAVTVNQRTDHRTVARLRFRVSMPQSAVATRVPRQQSREPWLEIEDFRLVWPALRLQASVHNVDLDGFIDPVF